MELQLKKILAFDTEKQIQQFKKWCFSSASIDSKIELLETFYSHHPTEAYDTITKFRDMIPFLKNESLENGIEMVFRIATSTKLPLSRRIECAVTLYNRFYLDYCYEAFESIAKNPNMKFIDEHIFLVDAIKYLYASTDDSYKLVAFDALQSLLTNESLQEDKKYGYVVQFGSKKGLSLLTNLQKAKIPFDKNFYIGLQKTVFDSFSLKYKILSAQSLIQNQSFLKESIEFLKNTGENRSLSENDRADAYDVLLRLCPEETAYAKEKLMELGKGTTLYTNSQNVHYFASQAEKIAEELYETYKIIPTFEKVVETLGLNGMEESSKSKVMKSLNRLKVDTATFTLYELSSSDVFCLIHTKIGDLKEEFGDEPMKRLFQELEEMDDTCSSGHFIRLINVLSGFGFGYCVDLVDEVKSALDARIATVFKNAPEEKKEILAMANSELADEDDLKSYHEFLDEILITIHAEMKLEYPKNPLDFENAFHQAKAKWIK